VNLNKCQREFLLGVNDVLIVYDTSNQTKSHASIVKATRTDKPAKLLPNTANLRVPPHHKLFLGGSFGSWEISLLAALLTAPEFEFFLSNPLYPECSSSLQDSMR